VSAATRDPLRAHVLEMLQGGQAHATFEDAVADVPQASRGALPPVAPHSLWQLVEHIRITQRDILDFSTNTSGSYHSPDWPSGFWPEGPEPPNSRAWSATVKAVLDDRGRMEALVSDTANDLFARFPWGSGQTLLREALLLADHTSYHVGQIVIVRRILGAWSD
jgi:DinB superfamily